MGFHENASQELKYNMIYERVQAWFVRVNFCLTTFEITENVYFFQKFCIQLMMRIFSLVKQNNVNTDGLKYDWLRQQFVYII